MKISRERVVEIIDNIIEYFDQRADVDHNGLDYIPNEEMRLLTEARELKFKIQQLEDET